jgi:uncharacterized membrane protein HdeD (DUF308 family)
MASSEAFDPTAAAPASGLGETRLAEDLRLERMPWLLAMAAAVTSVVVGVIMLVWPDQTLLVGAALFGIWLIVHGIVDIVDAIMAKADGGVARALSAVVGLLFVVGGIICLRNLAESVAVIATIIGLTWLIGGILALALALTSRYSGNARVLVAVLGAISVIGGLVVLIWPGMTQLSLDFFTGIWLIILGAVQFIVLLSTRPITEPSRVSSPAG